MSRRVARSCRHACGDAPEIYPPPCPACDGAGYSPVIVERRDHRHRGQLAWSWQGCVLCSSSGVLGQLEEAAE